MKESAIQLQIPSSITLYSDAATETMDTPTQCDAIVIHKLRMTELTHVVEVAQLLSLHRYRPFLSLC